jgi:hypothetical protein
MAGEAVSESRDVVLGFNAAWGFSPADQTSPAQAAGAGAVIDTEMTGERVTELRIHGVAGSDAPTMLEHPQALLFLELSDYYVNAVRLHVTAADALVRLGVDRDDVRYPPNSGRLTTQSP